MVAFGTQCWITVIFENRIFTRFRSLNPVMVPEIIIQTDYFISLPIFLRKRCVFLNACVHSFLNESFTAKALCF